MMRVFLAFYILAKIARRHRHETANVAIRTGGAMIETVLLIAEWPSRWEHWVGNWCNSPERQLVLLIQAPQESPSALCERVEHFFDQLVAANCQLTHATIARSTTSDVARPGAQHQLTAVVERKLSEVSHGTLLQLVADPDFERRPARATQ